MQRYLIALVLLTAPSMTLANTVEAKVKGMVCAFCVQGIEAKLREDPSVQDVKIDLDSGMVKVTSKPGAEITEQTVRNAVDFMGYETDSVRVTQ